MKILDADLGAASSEERFLAVDTEFIRENVEVPLLCLIQLATHANTFLIDPMTVDISCLKLFLESTDLRKVFHSAYQDIDLLHRSGIYPKNIYDTQQYEMLLSTKENVSYSSLVYKYTGKKLDKNYVLSNWRKRPLSREQVRYSASDVSYLRKIYRLQMHELAKVGRLGWLDPEMKELEVERSLYSGIDCDPELFITLANWVKKRASERNISEKSIADEKSIRRVCKKGRHYVQKMLKYRGLINEDFKDFLLFAQDILPDEVFRLPKHDPMLQALKLILEICSDENDIAPVLMATTHDLEDMICGSKHNDAIKCINGWRKEVFGNRAVSFLSGELSVRVIDGQPELIPNYAEQRK